MVLKKTHLRKPPRLQWLPPWHIWSSKIEGKMFWLLPWKKRWLGTNTNSVLVKIDPNLTNFESWNPLYDQRALQDKEVLKSSSAIMWMCLNKETVVISVGKEANSFTKSTPQPFCSKAKHQQLCCTMAYFGNSLLYVVYPTGVWR